MTTTTATAKKPTSDRKTDGQTSTASKHLVFITGDKGGTGKSTFARAYAHFLLEQGIKTVAFDADTRNAQLHRYYGKLFAQGVELLDLDDSDQVRHLLNCLSGDATVILIDLPAGTGKQMERLEQHSLIGQAAQANGYQLTFVTVLDRGVDCVNSLRSLMEGFGTRAHYIAVKNLHFGPPEKFKRFDQSRTKKMLAELGGVTLHLPELDDSTVDYLDMNSLSFKDGQDKDKSELADCIWVHAFITHVGEELNQANVHLGLREIKDEG